MSGINRDDWAAQRDGIVRQLTRAGGRHLIVVRYGPHHTTDKEWVYNAADIDRTAVIWAREMGAAEDAPLLGYFHDRTIWLLEADAQPARLLLWQK